MQIVFLSNYYNHHQFALSQKFYQLSEGNYYFIETSSMSKERKNLGYNVDGYPDYVKRYCTEKQSYISIINEADIVIFGSAPYKMIKERLKQGKLCFLYSERIYKTRFKWYEFPFRLVKYFFKFGRYNNLYLLCASAYTASDYSKTLTFLNRAYKWGYFPEVKRYDNIEKLLEIKQAASILWVGRFIDWKHPELPVFVAKRLKEEGYKFQLNLIGIGELQGFIKKIIDENNLWDCINLLGSMKPSDVRKWMERSEIFMVTSDRREGWGAVLNEAMNSGCAIVASHLIGSVPFLIKDEQNGLIYQNGNFNDLYNSIKRLLDSPDLCKKLGGFAYKTITTLWNAEVAAERFLKLANDINAHKITEDFFDGPCSKAKIIKDYWLKE